MNKIRHRKYIFILISFLIVGFASLTTSLLLTGKMNIGFKANDFDVYFSNVYLNDVKHNEFISPDGKHITFQSEKLINVGEQVILKYEISNSSTQYDARVDLNYNASTLDNEYINVEMRKEYENDTVAFNDKGIGYIIFTLKKPLTNDDTFDFLINMDANAAEAEVDDLDERPIIYEKPGDYSFSGSITDKDNIPIKDKPVVIISGNGIHYTQTDLEGNIYADDLAEGTQDVYIFDNHTFEEVKNMTVEEIKKYASDKITITTSTSGKATSENNQINNIEFNKTESIETISITIGNNTIEKVLNDKDVLEYNVDTNENSVEIDGLGIKPLYPGENRFEYVLEDGKTVTIVVNNKRPTAPILTGGSDEYINERKATITLEKEGSALSNVDHYQYYISDTPVDDLSTIVENGTTDNELEINTEGTKYIYYRTVSKNNTLSNWSNPEIVKLDYSNPTLDILSTNPSSNKISINYKATDNYSGIKNTICEIGENNEYGIQGVIGDGVCTFTELTNNQLYNYQICVDDFAGNERVCKTGEVRTNEIHNPVITFDNIESETGDYYLGQTAKINFDGTGVETPTFYIKTTRQGLSNINLSKTCGTKDSPGECTDITPTTKAEANVWYQVSGNLDISYSEPSDEYSQIIAVVYDGHNYSNKTTGTIGKIAFAAADLEYTNPLAPSVTNVQEAIDDLYTRLR